ncbi:MgtC/SapB family protein [Cohnella faecalis]|uniref:MgtC/SapB family protein n=1 Tax=Cohnella faecalis TaxID=2315694 RepID=A0A398CE52_9BACL|nr:MgtC/SapB family protein [Cohnella faecalis]RIE00910.1 MgtC/SapB family protein [Cohnella faecalis]
MHNPWVIDNVHILIRLLLAVILGGAIGFEREHHNHPAGFRTHILVCMGSTLIMMLSVYGFAEFVGEANVRIDPARLATAVITGVGFLGAGTILFTGKSITGLTTAASLWVVAAIGLAVGAGFNFAAIAASVIVLINLWVFNKIEQRFLKRRKTRVLIIQASTRDQLLDQVCDQLTNKAIITRDMRWANTKSELTDQRQTELHLKIDVPKSIEISKMIADLRRIDGVFAISIE